MFKKKIPWLFLSFFLVIIIFSPLKNILRYKNLDHDKVNIATSTFTPEVDFNDAVLKELPKMAIYERRMRESYVDHIEEVVFVDSMGNVTSENLEIRSEN
jgi:hypothetical protein